MWEEVIKKVVNVKIKTSLQLPSGIREINSRCSKSYKPSAKKNKDKAIHEYWDGDKDKAKSYNLSLTNSQSQTQAFKKNKYHGNRQRDHLATRVHTTKVAKKDKNKAKDLSHIKCYTYKLKGHYANKCPDKPKN